MLKKKLQAEFNCSNIFSIQEHSNAEVFRALLERREVEKFSKTIGKH